MITKQPLALALPLLVGLTAGASLAQPRIITPDPVPAQAQANPTGANTGASASSRSGTAVGKNSYPTIDPAYTAGAAVLTKAQQLDYDLLQAAYAGNTQRLRTLLARGAHLEARDGQYGFTPLMWAASNGNLGSVRYLIDKGAKVNARSQQGISVVLATGPVQTTPTAADETGTSYLQEATYIVARRGGVTPLILASAHGYALTVRELLRRGANPNLANPEGITPLACAAFKGYMPTVQALLGKGAQVNARDIYNGYPLMMAAVQGNTTVVRALLDRGARANQGASNGWTPLAIARAYGHTAVANLLRRAEATQKTTPQRKVTPRPVQQTKLPPPAVTPDRGASDLGIIIIR